MSSAALQQAAQDGLAIFNHIHTKGRPGNPEFLSMHSCRAILLLSSTKFGAGIGARFGHGYLMAKIDPSHPDEPIRWTAPIFVRFRYAIFGWMLGFVHHKSCILAMSDKILKVLQQGTRGLFGNEQGLVLGTRPEARFDVITMPYPYLDTLVNGVATGVIFNLSLAGGSMSVDTKAMQRAYGDHATMDAVLRGEIPPPQEMKPMYDFLASRLEAAKARK